MKPGDQEATQGDIQSPEKNRRLSHMRLSDNEQGADQAQPGDQEATQGTTCSPERNRILSYMRLSDSEHKTVQAEPGNQEATQGAVESPMKRLLNQRYVSCGDNLQEAGRSKRSWNKRKSTHES